MIDNKNKLQADKEGYFRYSEEFSLSHRIKIEMDIKPDTEIRNLSNNIDYTSKNNMIAIAVRGNNRETSGMSGFDLIFRGNIHKILHLNQKNTVRLNQGETQQFMVIIPPCSDKEFLGVKFKFWATSDAIEIYYSKTAPFPSSATRQNRWMGRGILNGKGNFTVLRRGTEETLDKLYISIRANYNSIVHLNFHFIQILPGGSRHRRVYCKDDFISKRG